MDLLIDPRHLLQRERQVLARHFGHNEAHAWHKFDVNTVDASLLHALGWAPDDIDNLRAGRPYYDLRDAASRLSVAGRRRLSRLLVVTPLQLPDGLTVLSPSLDDWVHAPRHADASDTESPALGRMDTAATAGAYQRGRRKPAKPDELESVDRARFPALVDGNGQTRYVDPRYVVVQARTAADDPAVLRSLQTLDLQVHKLIVPDPALMVLRLGSDRHGLAGLSNCLMALNGTPWVELAEPAWLGFEDLTERLDPHPIAPAEATWEALDVAGGASPPWNMRLMDWPTSAALPMGDASVYVVVVDTGVDLAHPALAVPPGSTAQRDKQDVTGGDGSDSHGHGTAVASVLVARRGSPWFGLVPGCSLLSLRVPMVASVESYALRRAALLSVMPRIAAGTSRWVINLSWRTAGDVALIRTAIEALSRAGALVVCSSGNEGDTSGRPHFPSDYPDVLSVGALDPQAQPAPYSNLGPQVDFMAPGGVEAAPIVCAAPGGGAVDCVGTSFAAPHLAGVAALLWSQFPQDSAAQLRARLAQLCGQPLSHAGTGAGLPQLSRLGAFANPPAPGTPAPASTWPLSGEALLARPGADCGLRSITRRLLLTRTQLTGWAEVGRLLGMTDAALTCLQDRWPDLP